MKLACFVILLSLVSCSFTEKYTFEEIQEISKKAGFEISLPKDKVTIVNCADFGKGCISGRKVIVRNLDMFIIEFGSEKQAKATATKIDEFYSRNWVFDDVSDEPLLEEYVRKVFNAKRPVLEKE